MDLGIRVNAIQPGFFNASVPFPKRMGSPEEFASLVMELVRNSYFNAQSVRIDGAIRMPSR